MQKLETPSEPLKQPPQPSSVTPLQSLSCQSQQTSPLGKFT